MIRWFLLFLAGWYLLGSLVTVSRIGRAREPLKPGEAVVVLIINGVMMVGLCLCVVWWGK